MQDTAKVPRKPEGRPAGRRPLVDERLADQLLGRAQEQGAELLGPDGLLSHAQYADAHGPRPGPRVKVKRYADHRRAAAGRG
jgi:hypothetical protein